mmetsp:Transcript_32895/g.84057  ORF Transcript_32895/g.84057 Transcript_32895/m.84057 type:complete len:218 (+) Transcript_32895:328-981(+)
MLPSQGVPAPPHQDRRRQRFARVVRHPWTLWAPGLDKLPPDGRRRASCRRRRPGSQARWPGCAAAPAAAEVSCRRECTAEPKPPAVRREGAAEFRLGRMHRQPLGIAWLPAAAERARPQRRSQGQNRRASGAGGRDHPQPAPAERPRPCSQRGPVKAAGRCGAEAAWAGAVRDRLTLPPCPPGPGPAAPALYAAARRSCSPARPDWRRKRRPRRSGA